MNSGRLREQHASVYESFFAKNDLVLSTDLDFLWTDDIVIKHGGLMVYQKLPMKMYLGFEKVEGDGLQFGDLVQYIPDEGAFSEGRFDYAYLPEVLDYLHREFDLEGGYRVNVLVEITRGRNVSFSGPFCSMLVVGMALLSEEIDTCVLDGWEGVPVMSLLQEKERRFAYLYHHAWRVLSILREGYSTGGCVLAAMVSSDYPLMYFSRTPASKNCIAMRLNEAFELPEKPSWPIDFNLIFSGNMISPEEVARSLSTFQDDLTKDLASLKEAFSKVPGLVKDEEGSHFLGEFLREDVIYQKYCGMMHVTEIRMLASMKRILMRGFVQKDLREFFDTVNHVRYGSRLVSSPIFVLNLMYYMIRESGRQRGNELGVGAKFFGFGRMGGSLLIATPYRDMRKLLGLVIDDLNQTYSVHVDYQSSVDGRGKDGIQVEQFLGQKQYSDVLMQGSLVVKSFMRGDVVTSVASLERIQSSSDEADILLDVSKKKVFVAGQALTSKDVHSQSAIVELLVMCLDSPRRRVLNRDMPRSSYAENKHELVSKVVTPFMKLVSERLGRELPLRVEGNTQEFSLILGNNLPMQIMVVQRVGE